jgi:4-hydroxy-3-methylbut-2-enyl diphosphate reductase
MVREPASERAGIRAERFLMIETHTTPHTILLASPRGFRAGVDRAIQIVERAIARYGRPVYVRHEIVHNRCVVEGLEAKGAIFVEELDGVPDDRPVVFSAHGVPKAVPAEAARRNLIFIDATCPLVSKVHREAERHHECGRTVVLIGHAGHPEVIGTMGQLPAGALLLVKDVAEAEALDVPDPHNLAYATQTTLSVDDTIEIVAILRRRFPAIEGPKLEDICYATSNRQAAVKAIARHCDARSWKSRMRRSPPAQRAADMDWNWLVGAGRLGITAGASAPELLVDELVAACRERFDVAVEEVRTTEESVVFKLPRTLVA